MNIDEIEFRNAEDAGLNSRVTGSACILKFYFKALGLNDPEQQMEVELAVERLYEAAVKETAMPLIAYIKELEARIEGLEARMRKQECRECR